MWQIFATIQPKWQALNQPHLKLFYNYLTGRLYDTVIRKGNFDGRNNIKAIQIRNFVLTYSSTPVSEIQLPIDNLNLCLLVKREDLNHPLVSGNKWWKLKYNLEEAAKQKKQTLLTFGGAFSNHIYATAAAGYELGFESIGVIRGEETLPLNPTLSFAASKGMRLHYVSRETYRRKTENDFIETLNAQFGDFYLIPEGGTNDLAIKGCKEWGEKLLGEIEFDHLCLPVGTGGTIAGIIEAFRGEKKITGFSSLKDGSFLQSDINQWLTGNYNNWQIQTDFHFGGYAKMTQELKEFILDVERKYQLPLDPIYTSKMMFGVLKLIEEGYFEKDKSILLLHTGGMQGRAGFNF
jgi:1-aminocyclopropane-1-carboxylate deaminase